MSIRIEKNTYGSYSFYGSKLGLHYKGSRCSACYKPINPEYVYIIENLMRAGLLDESYPLLCCWCYKLTETVKCPKCNGKTVRTYHYTFGFVKHVCRKCNIAIPGD